MSAQSASKQAALKYYPYFTTQQRIAEFIQIVRPKKGPKFANMMAHWIVGSAFRLDLDPYIIAATAYHESKFDMHDIPQTGIMQLVQSEFNETYGGKGFDIYNPRDNILMGTDWLAMYLRRDNKSRLGRDRKVPPSRGIGSSRDRRYGAFLTCPTHSQLARMWGRYNGSGPNGDYAARSFKIKDRIQYGAPSQWREWTKDGRSIWLPPIKARKR